MRTVLTKLTPTRGFSTFLHYVLVVLLPLLVFVLVRLDFVILAVIVVILAKWRMFAVRPRFWPANMRANSVDIMFGVSMVIFMQQTTSMSVQLLWAVVYAGWLVYVKPRSTTFWMSVQAGLSQLAALSAVYSAWADRSVLILSALTGVICYLAARHFIDSFDEVYARLLSYVWGYFGAAIAWLCGHWLFDYIHVAQPTFFLTVIGYGLASLYYFDHHERLNKLVRNQIVGGVIVIIILTILVSVVRGDWGHKVV